MTRTTRRIWYNLKALGEDVSKNGFFWKKICSIMLQNSGTVQNKQRRAFNNFHIYNFQKKGSY